MAFDPWDFERQVGETYWFEYHCWESLDSGDAKAWLRSHEQVTVIAEQDSDAWEGSTFTERAEAGQPRVFLARWADGFEWSVCEDELLTTRDDFCCPDPPRSPAFARMLDNSGYNV
jgi:hypothetical protein